MGKLLVCMKVEFKHENIPLRMEIEFEKDAETAYKIMADRTLDEITKLNLRFYMNDGKVIRHELRPEDIKDMWLEEVK